MPRRGLDWTSVAIIVGELILALWLLFAISQAGLEGWEWWLVAFPFQLFAGWVSAATFVNLSSTMVRSHVGSPVAPTGTDARRPAVALILIGAAALLGLFVTLLSGAWPYALAVAWALGGIVLANRARATIAGTAGAGALALALAVAVSPAAAQIQTISEDIGVQTIATPTLDIAYLERGPSNGPVTIPVHGFPDDATGWLPIMDALAERGVRTLAPYLRGFGPTHLRDEKTPRFRAGRGPRLGPARLYGRSRDRAGHAGRAGLWGAPSKASRRCIPNGWSGSSPSAATLSSSGRTVPRRPTP